jgi:hypothetical protein
MEQKQKILAWHPGGKKALLRPGRRWEADTEVGLERDRERRYELDSSGCE